jgi:radical SAM-linked protein
MQYCQGDGHIAVLDDKSGGFAGRRLPGDNRETVLVIIKFTLRGNLRFLSHAETVKVFQRACARSDIKVQYSQGFNPRPKLSLPLPRSVGIEVDEDVLCMWVPAAELPTLKARLSNQLPDGFELLSVNSAEAKTSFRPKLATYVLVLREQGGVLQKKSEQYINEKLKTRIKSLLASESLNLQRQIDEKGNIRSVDVRPFLKSIDFDGTDITVECNISPAGSIRVDEILRLLELDVEHLAVPIRRTRVEWKN